VKRRFYLHEQESPFPRDHVIDERCTCQHLRSDHFDSVAYGHGPCAVCRTCKQFTWAGMVEIESERPG